MGEAGLRRKPWGRPSVLPGFGLTLGYTLSYMGLMVALPLLALFVRAFGGGFAAFWRAATAPRVIDSYILSFGGALAAASVNVILGSLLAWVLVRYSFPGRRLVDALNAQPFALPTAVTGIALTTLLGPGGRLGGPLEAIGVKVAFTPLGVGVAMVFIGLPFVVRTVQPVLDDLSAETEEVAASLGASRLQTFRLVILPSLLPAAITGFALAFARAVGEYGSIIFIAGNLPNRTEIAPLLIVIKLEQYDYAAAAAIAAAMLIASFAVLLAINGAQRWVCRRTGRA